jgi:hypothetical protein
MGKKWKMLFPDVSAMEMHARRSVSRSAIKVKAVFEQ